MLSVWMSGFVASASLIIAIGAQNAFVMRQGLSRSHLFLTAVLCSLIDAGLIICGVLGFGKIVGSAPFFLVLARVFACVFLFLHGALSFRSAFKAKMLEQSTDALMSRKKTCLMILAFSLLNPHVYLDTVILLGSIASQQQATDRPYFAIGAISASFVWFFSLAYGSRLLAPLFAKPRAWRVIDCLVAATMWGLCLTLIFQ